MKIIPFDPTISSVQEFNVNLGELVCDFVFTWNIRAGAWFCDFKTTTGNNNSVRIVEKTPLLGVVNATGLNGDFRVLKFDKMSGNPITYDNFGSVWKLVYATNDEWQEYDDGVAT